MVEAEAKRARLAIASELSACDQQLADLQQMLATNNEKLAALQKIQADIELRRAQAIRPELIKRSARLK